MCIRDRSDISEVTSRRVLAKNAAAQASLGKLFDEHRGRLTENIRLSADIKLPELSREAFIDLCRKTPELMMRMMVVFAHRLEAAYKRETIERRRQLKGSLQHFDIPTILQALGRSQGTLTIHNGLGERRAEIAAWNEASPVIKRGLALTPVKFGISFTATHYNQAGALLHVYSDGTALLNHGGTEMGQGLFTKVQQVVAQELGIAPDRVRVSASDTSKVPNASPTAASSGRITATRLPFRSASLPSFARLLTSTAPPST